MSLKKNWHMKKNYVKLFDEIINDIIYCDYPNRVVTFFFYHDINIFCKFFQYFIAATKSLHFFAKNNIK